LQIEWVETEENINKSRRLLQEEIFNRFIADADAGLLFLGFCDQHVALSPSLQYWRDFARLFARKLSQTPELELLRHKTHVAFDQEELITLSDSAPLMPGSEYVSTEQKIGDRQIMLIPQVGDVDKVRCTMPSI
jgi:non-specific serine/threonine protein kinase